jgi:hypothetical protein
LNEESTAKFYLTLSFVGALFIIILMAFYPSDIDPLWRNFADKLIIGGIFVFACLLGISMAFKPNWIGRFIRQKTHGNNVTDVPSQKIERRGHHPNCGVFKGHTISINNRILCAGCTGLIIGAVIAIILTLLYIIIPYTTSRSILIGLLIIGLVLINSNYFLIIHGRNKGKIHFVSNVLFVIGFFMVISSFYQFTGRYIFGILSIMIAFLWLDTRILLSKWQHQVLCDNCTQVDCSEKNVLRA